MGTRPAWNGAGLRAGHEVQVLGVNSRLHCILPMYTGAESELSLPSKRTTVAAWRDTGAAVAPATTPQGETPYPLSGVPPRQGAGVSGPSGRGHRAPPRGVDVKATPLEGPGEPPGGGKTPNLGKNAQKRGKWPF